MPKPKRQDGIVELTQDDEQVLYSVAYRDDLAKNRQRRVSDRQRDRMRRWAFEFSPEETKQVRATLGRERVTDFSPVLVTFGFSFIMLMLILQATWPNHVVLCIMTLGMWGVTLWRMKPRPLTDAEIVEQLQSGLQSRRDYMQETGDQGKVIRVDGVPIYKEPSTIVIDGVAYRVERPLWRWLRLNSQYVAVYAIKEWYPPYALSAEPLDVPIPLTPEERLQRVVGVNSEGELVYADDPAHEDARRIDHL